MDAYREFVECIRTDLAQERKIVNRRMFSVFLWCFVVPAITAGAIILLTKFGVLPKYFRRYLDSLLVIFPVAYALYVLSFDVIAELPLLARKGGIWSHLGRGLKDQEWRNRVCSELETRFPVADTDASYRTWRYLAKNLEIDLSNLHHRTRYLTALAGAVFFLLMQGIDSLDETGSFESPRQMVMSLMDSATGLSQFVGLGIFLVLFYLSGNQVYHSLFRYLNCAELILMKFEEQQLSRKAVGPKS